MEVLPVLRASLLIYRRIALLGCPQGCHELRGGGLVRSAAARKDPEDSSESFTLLLHCSRARWIDAISFLKSVSWAILQRFERVYL